MGDYSKGPRFARVRWRGRFSGAVWATFGRAFRHGRRRWSGSLFSPPCMPCFSPARQSRKWLGNTSGVLIIGLPCWHILGRL